MVQGFSREPGTQGPLVEVPAAGLRRIWRWGVLIAVGGFLFGFDTGVISGALLFIAPEFDLGATEQGTVVSVLLLGAMVGASGIGRLSDRWGRRTVFGQIGVVFLLGTALAVLATNYPMLLLARVVLGLAVGAASATVPVYLSEISPTRIRGRMLTLNQLMITVGILAAYVVNVAFSADGLWRGMFAAGAVPALVIMVGAFFLLPESPQWLLTQGRRDEARREITSVTNEATADQLIERFDQRRRQAEEQRERDQPSTRAGRKVLTAPHVRPALIVGLVLAAVQQFGGINTIIYYAPTIMKQTGLSASNSIVYSIAIGVINLVMTLVAIRLIDRVGRRPLLITSLAGMALTMALLGWAFVVGGHPVLALVFMVAYIALYAGGLGPIFWTLIGEIFPPSARAAGSSASTTVNWMSNFVVSLAFLPLVTAIGQGQTFGIFAVICVLALLFVGRCVPETRNRTFDEVDANLRERFHREPA